MQAGRCAGADFVEDFGVEASVDDFLTGGFAGLEAYADDEEGDETAAYGVEERVDLASCDGDHGDEGG